MALYVHSQSLSKKDIKSFCNEFAGYISDGDMENAMLYIDEDIRIQQHDIFLNGNTPQFFSELLGGVDKKNNFVLPDIKQIKKMKPLKITSIDQGFTEVQFKIILIDGKSIITTLTLNVNSKEEMTIIPAVG